MEQSEGALDGKMRVIQLQRKSLHQSCTRAAPELHQSCIQLQRQSLQKLTKKVVAYALYLKQTNQ